VPWSFTAHRWDIAENNLLETKIRAAVFARVISLNGRDEILKILGESTCSSLLVIHMGTTLPNQNDARFAKNNREFHIACIGNLLEVKGHRYLIEACRLLRERGCRFVCHIIGGGPLWSDLEALVHHTGLQEYVQLRGRLPHDEVMRMLQGREIDVVVHPSIETPSGEHEGIPVALMETLAHRVPAISTVSGGISELLDGGAGVLVKPADSKALADAIQRVLEDADYRASLIETGYARVSVDFNIQTVADRLVALMEAPGGGKWIDSCVECSTIQDNVH
jgi:glycosyltransferase involved in cell wall biosynthesis